LSFRLSPLSAPAGRIVATMARPETALAWRTQGKTPPPSIAGERASGANPWPENATEAHGG